MSIDFEGMRALLGAEDELPADPEVRRLSAGKRSLSQFIPSMIGVAQADAAQPLPAPLRGRLERSLGTELGSVRMRSGSGSATAADAFGARAFTLGPDIYFGAGRLDPDSVAGQRLIAHEVAHTVQQRGAAPVRQDAPIGMSTPGDAFEVEAESFADQFIGGGRGPRLTPVRAGSVHRSVVQRDGEGGAADVALNFILDRITSADTLASALASLSTTVAQRVIDVIVSRAPQILVDFLIANPTTALLVYIVRRLPTDRIREFFEGLDAAAIGRVLRALAGAGLLLTVGPILFALAPDLVRQIMREVGREVLEPLLRGLQQAKDWIKQVLTEYWPVGTGVHVEGGLGATFGYPIYLGGDELFVLSHTPTQGNFHFLRRGEMRVAGDTGAGAGVFIGTGGRGRAGEGGGSPSSGAGGIGIGATAGAEAQAGVKVIVHQEFDFPVTEDAAFFSMLIAVAGMDTGAAFGIARLVFEPLRSVDPMLYNTRTMFEGKLYGEGRASAEAGVRTAGEGTAPGGGTWGRTDGARDTGSQNWWQRILNLSASISGRLTAEGGVGCDARMDWTGVADRRNGPREVTIDLYIEGQVGLEIAATLSYFSSLLPPLPSLAAGGGIKATFKASGNPADTEPQLRFQGISLYTKTGETDIYRGEATEVSVGLRNLSADTFRDLDSFLNSIDGGVRLFRRFSAASTIGRRFLGQSGRQATFQTMLPREYRSVGFTMEGYIDFEAEISVAQVRQIFRSIATAYRAAARDLSGDWLQRLYQHFCAFVTAGEAPAYITTCLTEVANALLSGLKKLQLHGQAGLRVAAGGQVSEGAKVRLHGSGGAMITLDYDVLQAIGGRDGVQVNDIAQLLRQASSAAAGYLEFDGAGNLVDATALPAPAAAAGG